MFAQVADTRNVVGCYVGFKVKNRKMTRRRSVVCLVTRKIKPDRLRKEHLIPPGLSWTDASGSQHWLPTDVLVSTGRIRSYAGFAGPGDDVATVNGEVASIGIALIHPALGRVVTTAAHAFTSVPGIQTFAGATAPRVRVSAFRGGPATCDADVVKIHLSDLADYALLRPLAGVDCANLFRDEATVSRPFIPGSGDLGKLLVVLTASGAKHTTFQGVFGQMLHQPSGVRMSNLLLTDPVTVPGDSGACLADVSNGELRAWGLLVGTATVNGKAMSVYTTAVAPLVLESAEYLA
jgi:hypothetical protein